MIVGEKIAEKWSMDQAAQYAKDHVIDSDKLAEKNIFDFEIFIGVLITFFSYIF